MSHNVETMAYAGEVPWHGLGVKVPADLSPEQMMEKAGLDWTVRKVPAFAEVAGDRIAVGRSALVRDTDNSILDVVSDDWNILQNSEAFEFFYDFVAAGDMEMHTAGSLKNGQIVWALAKVNESFDLFKGKDQIDSYLLFSNPHKYGWSIDVRFTPIRVVCNNTLTLSLNQASKNVVKVTHRRQFDADEVKETLGVAKEKLESYREMAQILGNKRYTTKSLTEYMSTVFPVTSRGDSKKSISKNATTALDIVQTGNQPGSEFGRGTFWEAFNGVTYMIDHKLGRNDDQRMVNSWFGYNRAVKNKALETAVKMAAAA